MKKNMLFIFSMFHLINFSLLLSNSEPDVFTEKNKFEKPLKERWKKIKKAIKNRGQQDQKKETDESQIESEGKEKIVTPEKQDLIEEGVASQFIQSSQSQEKTVIPTPIIVSNNSHLTWCDRSQVACVALSFLVSFSIVVVPALIYNHYN